MEKLKIKACAPPGCGCPVLTVEQDATGKELVYIVDDYSYVVQMTVPEFQILAEEFLKKYNKI